MDTDRIKAEFDFYSLIQADTQLKKIGQYHVGPCPFCGGRDRFTVKQSNSGEFIWHCRKCCESKYQDVIEYVMRRENVDFYDALKHMNIPLCDKEYIHPAPIDTQNHEQERRQRRRKLLTEQEIWLELHNNLTEDARLWWRKQGVPDSWQDYLKLGYTDDKPYYNGTDELLHAPAYSIPYFHYEEKALQNHGQNSYAFVTLQYRLCSNFPNARYRFEYGLGSSFYVTCPTEPIKSQIVICEGAKKAIVVRIFGVVDKDISIVAVPSKSDWGGVVDIAKNKNRVWIILDPDAHTKPYELAQEIGKHARVVELPVKVDDALLNKWITKSQLVRYIVQGVKV